MKRVFVLFILFFGLLPSIHAAGAPEIRFRSTNSTIGCAVNSTLFRLNGPFANVDNALSYPYEGIVYDENGNIYEDTVGTAPGSTLNDPTFGWVFEAGNSGGSVNASYPIPNDTTFALRLVLYYPSGVPSWVAIIHIEKCNGGGAVTLRDFPYPLEGLPSIGHTHDGPPDNRINWHYGDAHIGILYPSDNGGINLYSYADHTYSFEFLSPAMLEAFANNLLSDAVLLAQKGLVAAYLLPDGRIQFNLGPDAEGKWYVVILDDLADRDIDGIAYDPNQ